MLPTYVGAVGKDADGKLIKPYDRVLLSRYLYKIKSGDVIVFQYGNEIVQGETVPRYLIKRVIATAGETIRFSAYGGDKYVRLEKKNANGVYEEVKEDYINETMLKNPPMNATFPSSFKFDTDITVPESYIYVMGDNRNVSHDSRSISFVDVKSVDGKVVAVLGKEGLFNRLLTFFYKESVGR